MTQSPPLDSRPARNRRAHKQTHVAHCLRSEIVEGQFHPGEQMPTFDQMEQRFGISRGVLRQAIDRLKQDGFVESIDRQGLYVASRPPHLNRYGLILPGNPAAENWSRLSLALSNEAQRMNHSSDVRQIAVYHDIHPDALNKSFEQLCYDVATRRLAGVILAPGTPHMAMAEPLNQPDLPKVHLLDADENPPSINSDERTHVEMALNWLKHRKRQRIAMLVSSALIDRQKSYLDVCERVVKRQWIQPVCNDHPHTARRIVELLMDRPASQRPDALWIRDDNFVSSALAGLNDLGLRIGSDIDVLASCNFPWPPSTDLPVKRLGYDIRAFLEAGLQSIEKQVHSEPVPDLQYIKPVFEEDLPKNPATPRIATRM